MTKQELKKLMDEMANTAHVEKMSEAGAAMSTYLIEHPEDTAEVMEWFTAAQQQMMAVASGATSTPAESKSSSNDNFEYIFIPGPDTEKEFPEHFAWTYSTLCAEIENLKAEGAKLTGLLLHCDGEPDFFDMQGWEMNDGKHGDELFMHDFAEYDDSEEGDYDEKDEDEDEENFDPEAYYAEVAPLHNAKPDIFGAAIAKIHQEGKWADIIGKYPFMIEIEVHDDAADTEFLIIHNEQGAKPAASEVSSALSGNKKRRTAEDFYNDILSGK